MSKNTTATVSAAAVAPVVEEAVKQGLVPSQAVTEEPKVELTVDEIKAVVEQMEEEQTSADEKPKKFEFVRGLARKYKKPLVAAGVVVGGILVTAVVNAIVAAGRPSEDLIEDENPYAETDAVEENPEA